MPTLYVSRRPLAVVVLQTIVWSVIFTVAHADDAAADKPASQAQSASASPASQSEKPAADEPQPAETSRDNQLAKYIIGATALIVEPQSKLAFQARVDTGAASCSIHCEEWEIEDEAESMEENIGKPIRILLGNHEDEPEWVESQIDRCVTVKTSERKETRYKVPLTFRWKNIEKQVVVTLNNRGHMNYPVLLGRNFLEGDFLVDIGQRDDQTDELTRAK